MKLSADKISKLQLCAKENLINIHQEKRTNRRFQIMINSGQYDNQVIFAFRTFDFVKFPQICMYASTNIYI